MKKIVVLILSVAGIWSCEKPESVSSYSKATTGLSKTTETNTLDGSIAKSNVVGAWVRQFTDDFNSLNITSVWKPFSSSTNTDPNSIYCKYSTNALKTASVDGTNSLVITATKTGTNAFQSGRIKSYLSITPTTNTEYRISSRIKLVALNGSTYTSFSSTYGAWPAFWTTQETGWPIYGEIDILEGYSKSTTSATNTSFTSNLFYGTVANTDVLKNTLVKKYTDVNSAFSSSGWHTYDLYWSNTNGVVSVTTKVDGITIMTRTNSSSSKLNLNNFKTHNIILNMCVGSTSSSIFTSPGAVNLLTNTQMWVDYVTVDKRTL